jgi:hypothetical protein
MAGYLHSHLPQFVLKIYKIIILQIDIDELSDNGVDSNIEQNHVASYSPEPNAVDLHPNITQPATEEPGEPLLLEAITTGAPPMAATEVAAMANATEVTVSSLNHTVTDSLGSEDLNETIYTTFTPTSLVTSITTSMPVITFDPERLFPVPVASTPLTLIPGSLKPRIMFNTPVPTFPAYIRSATTTSIDDITFSTSGNTTLHNLTSYMSPLTHPPHTYVQRYTPHSFIPVGVPSWPTSTSIPLASQLFIIYVNIYYIVSFKGFACALILGAISMQSFYTGEGD